MQPLDLINGTFEGGIGIFQINNIRILRKHKEIKGIHWSLTAWTSLWGFFNLSYYWYLSQPFSWFCSLLIFAANLTWLGHVLYYERMNKKIRDE